MDRIGGKIEGVRYVGFDLDGTLYPTVGAIDERVRDRIAEAILSKRPLLRSVSSARAYFNERYAVLGSGSEVLKECDYTNPGIVMDDCLATADVLDLISPNPSLVNLMGKLQVKYTTYLLTSGPEDLALSKLERIGIDPSVFDFRFFSDNPLGFSKINGTAFQNALRKMGHSDGEGHVYVGDREKSDIIYPRALRMKTVKVGGSKGSADYLINRIEDLGDLLL